MCNHNILAGVVIVGVLTVFGGTSVTWAEKSEAGKPDEHDKKEKKELRVEDLPKPIPGIMDTLQRIGNEVGDGISKATSEGAKAIKKTLSDEETPSKDK
jgi:hypothetical protein